MLRLAILLIVATAGDAIASVDCDATAARWVEITPAKPEATLGQPMSDAVQEVGKRWSLAASSYVGVYLVFTNGQQDLHTAEALLLTDALIDCWQPETASESADAEAMVAKFDKTISPEKRTSVRNAAEAIMKGEN